MKAQKPVIAVDIDDVLADHAAGFVEYTNRVWKTNFITSDYDEDWTKLWPVNGVEELEQRAYDFLFEAPRNYQSIDGALSVLRRLGGDYTLRAVTSRRAWMRDITRGWLEQHYPGVFSDETIHFAGIWDDSADSERINRTKLNIIEQLDATYLIDDQLKHCVAIASSGRQALLFGDYSWNQVSGLPVGVARVSDWQAVERYFYGEL